MDLRAPIILRVSCDDKNVSISLSRGQETVGHVYGVDSHAENIAGDLFELIWPKELVRKLISFSLRKLKLVNDLRDVWNDGDLARTKWTELRDEEELRLVLKLFDRDKGRAWCLDCSQVPPPNGRRVSNSSEES